MCDFVSWNLALVLIHASPFHVFMLALTCVCMSTYICKCSFMLVCDYAFVYVFACVYACLTFSISMEIKCGTSHKFTHSPCFDSIQSTVCIITPVPYGNLLGPKYCSLTNPSFVFSRCTKHQSCFSTHAAHQPPTSSSVFTHTHTHTHTRTCTHHACPSPLPETQSNVEPKSG